MPRPPSSSSPSARYPLLSSLSFPCFALKPCPANRSLSSKSSPPSFAFAFPFPFTSRANRPDLHNHTQFLNVPLPPPSVPFPRVNDAASIKVFMLKKVALGVACWVALGIAGWGGWRIVRGLLEM